MTVTLLVDQDHPFYFDHPLDHVPGMLLVGRLLDMVGDRSGRAAVTIDFGTICELDQQTALAAEADGDGWRLAATQNGTPVAEGTLTTSDGPAFFAAGDIAPDPVDEDLVHRARLENVALGEPILDQDGEIRVPVLPPRGYLAEKGGYSLEGLIEAGRQLATLFAHIVEVHPLDTQLLWSRLEADLPWSAPADAALFLRSRPAPAKGRRLRYEAELVGGDGRVHGTVAISCQAVNPATYQRFRNAAAEKAAENAAENAAARRAA